MSVLLFVLDDLIGSLMRKLWDSKAHTSYRNNREYIGSEHGYDERVFWD